MQVKDNQPKERLHWSWRAFFHHLLLNSLICLAVGALVQWLFAIMDGSSFSLRSFFSQAFTTAVLLTLFSSYARPSDITLLDQWIKKWKQRKTLKP